MKTIKAYQRVPFVIGLSKKIGKNRVVYFPCYHSALDARLENPNKVIISFYDLYLNEPMYVPFSVSQCRNFYYLKRIKLCKDRIVFSSDYERLVEKGVL